MSGQDTLRLDRLELTNFRCFAECAIDLHPELTVLVADNGKGKTALLDAIGIALGLYVHTLDPIHNPPKNVSFELADVRRHISVGSMTSALPVSVRARGQVDGKQIQWLRELLSETNIRTADAKAGKLKTTAKGVRARLDAYVANPTGIAPVLPVVASYGTGRLWSETRLTAERRAVGLDQSTLGRFAGYLDCLLPSSSFKTFLVWYESMMASMKSMPVSGGVQVDRPEILVAAVEVAMRVVLGPTKWDRLLWHDGTLMVAHRDGTILPLAHLSDGVRSMIALVADLAHRCVRLNPGFKLEAAKLTPGIVLIDEVDMHLHPGWQQSVIGLLREAFPKIQFVVTTHSPQVLSTVDVASIRVLRVRDGVGALETPKFQTRGVESASVLAVIMGIDPVPVVPEAAMLREYRALIEDGAHETSRASELLDQLNAHFGESHPVMAACRTLLRFQAYKLRRPGVPVGVAER